MKTTSPPALLRPGDEGYDAACAAWNLNVHHRPALAVMAGSAHDVAAAVRTARAEGLGVAVMATGHGTVPCDGGLLINTSRLTTVDVDPRARTATVGAGARWSDLVPLAAGHGLAGLPGSSTGVGIVGYTAGGGFGWLGRHLGFAAGSIRRAEVVTADGDIVTASPDEHTDLLWGLGGGSGNFGVVTALELALHPVGPAWAGNLYYPLDRARDVLAGYAEWTRGLPDAMATAVAFRAFPPMPAVPDELRGRTFVTVRGAHSGTDPADGRALTTALRAALGEPAVDTFRVMPVAALDAVSMDPTFPIAARQHCELLADLTPATIATLAELGPRSPLIMLEMRHLGGALARPVSHPSPMAHTTARFSMNGVGPTPTPDRAAAVRGFLAELATAMAPHATGETYLNFLDLDGATPARVRAAYSAADWARLVALKDRYDPHDLFRFTRTIPPTGEQS